MAIAITVSAYPSPRAPDADARLGRRTRLVPPKSATRFPAPARFWGIAVAPRRQANRRWQQMVRDTSAIPKQRGDRRVGAPSHSDAAAPPSSLAGVSSSRACREGEGRHSMGNTYLAQLRLIQCEEQKVREPAGPGKPTPAPAGSRAGPARPSAQLFRPPRRARSREKAATGTSADSTRTGRFVEALRRYALEGLAHQDVVRGIRGTRCDTARNHGRATPRHGETASRK